MKKKYEKILKDNKRLREDILTLVNQPDSDEAIAIKIKYIFIYEQEKLAAKMLQVLKNNEPLGILNTVGL